MKEQSFNSQFIKKKIKDNEVKVCLKRGTILSISFSTFPSFCSKFVNYYNFTFIYIVTLRIRDYCLVCHNYLVVEQVKKVEKLSILIKIETAGSWGQQVPEKLR